MKFIYIVGGNSMAISFSIIPPQNWQDFEDMVLDVAKVTIADNFDKYGRAGQQQYGVDIYGHDKNWSCVGIQCKHKRQYDCNGSVVGYNTTITTNDIDDELQMAMQFTPKLTKFIIATTSLRDIKLQNHANYLNQHRDANGFIVEIWFWEKFQLDFNKNSSLLYYYYDNFLREHDMYSKDIHILSFIKKAFMRPAFTTEFQLENSCEDFLTAISDTQNAINTGNLVDRNGNVVRTSFSFDDISNEDWKTKIHSISSMLQKIRDCYTEAIKIGIIHQNANFIEIIDHGVSEKLNCYRAKAIIELNSILSENNDGIIESPLLEYRYHPDFYKL